MITTHLIAKRSGLSGRHLVNKLTPQDVKEIRAAYVPYVRTHSMLGRKYGVHPSTVQDVTSYTTWKDVR